MTKQKSRIPDFKTFEEEAAWWDTHDPADYQDELKVYAREGEPCRRCRAPIVKTRYSNKPLYYCEACQV